jgi:hypothetical protein
MLISFKVLILRAAIDLQISLKSSSGQTVKWKIVLVLRGKRAPEAFGKVEEFRKDRKIKMKL